MDPVHGKNNRAGQIRGDDRVGQMSSDRGPANYRVMGLIGSVRILSHSGFQIISDHFTFQCIDLDQFANLSGQISFI
jgi:hypothetical protein